MWNSIGKKSNGQENASVLKGFDTVTGVGIPVWSTSVFHFVHSRDPYWQDALRFSSITSHWSLFLYDCIKNPDLVEICNAREHAKIRQRIQRFSLLRKIATAEDYSWTSLQLLHSCSWLVGDIVWSLEKQQQQ